MKYTIFIFSFVIASYVNAQKIKTKGDLDQLKKVKKIDLEFTYNNMSVGKYEHETDYLNERVEERNTKEPGSGDKWKESWFNDRDKRFEPHFVELFNKHAEKKGIKASEEMDEAPIKMLIHTHFTEPGFNVGVWRKPASINVEIRFINTSSNTTFATMNVDKVPGRDAMGFDFDTGYRLEEAYAKLGKEVAKYLTKKVL